MAGYYNKDTIKSQLEIEQIYDLLVQLGGEPEYVETGLISQTICHNQPGEGSRKLYYYENSKLFNCYSGCEEPSFDVFQLIIKTAKIQRNLDYELYDAMCYIADFFGLAEAPRPKEHNNELKDWKIFDRYDYSTEKTQLVQLKEYNKSILNRFNYPRILNWEAEGISKEICKKYMIGYYPTYEQITIPHFDISGRLVGIRGRSLAEDDANRYGKYRPLTIDGKTYSHALSMNLYNLNFSFKAIQTAKAAIVYESEKSCMKSRCLYGDSDISVACCGSSLSAYQVEMLLQLGVREIIIAFDRQFQEIGDEEFKRLKHKLIGFHNKYKNRVKITCIFDKGMLTDYKDSPIDQGKSIFEELLNNRFIPTNKND
jgi:hypothetical protein